MQITNPHKCNSKPEAVKRKPDSPETLLQHYAHLVETWEKLMAEGVIEKTCQQVIGISRASYYRYRRALKDKNWKPGSKAPKRRRKKQWGEREKQQVLAVRRANPSYGKEKIALILARDRSVILSESTVGRILKYLFAKGTLQKSVSAPRPKRPRNFAKKHAQPWTYKDYDKMEMGERVQIDHMTVTKNGRTYKHFQAWERRSKFIHAQIYHFANSIQAKRFLLEFIKKAPFKIRSIQVDGGSEFMAEFEDACAEAGLPLIVLPPKRPTFNGGVERGNRIFREEFYARPELHAQTMSDMRIELEKALTKYNTYRPHKNLDGLTPMAYIEKSYSEVERLSQIM